MYKASVFSKYLFWLFPIWHDWYTEFIDACQVAILVVKRPLLTIFGWLDLPISSANKIWYFSQENQCWQASQGRISRHQALNPVHEGVSMFLCFIRGQMNNLYIYSWNRMLSDFGTGSHEDENWWHSGMTEEKTYGNFFSCSFGHITLPNLS